MRTQAKDVLIGTAREIRPEHAKLEIGRKPKVLVVDDEQVIANTLTIILKQAGFTAEAAYSGESAIKIADHFAPDLLISDVIMTGITGIEAAIQIRTKLPKCKVYLFAGQAATQDLLQRAKLQGHTFFEVFRKPVHPTEIFEKIQAERFELEEEQYSPDEGLASHSEDQIAVTMIGNRLRLVNLSPDGSCSFVEEVGQFRDMFYIWSAETQAFKKSIDELEHLINEPQTKEADLQLFFERHPDLIKEADYKAAHPHVVLSRDEGDLIPDFMLQPHDQDELCDLLELKLPHVEIYNLQRNRYRLSAAVHEGIAQLREYANFFNETKNRRLVSDRYHLKAYRPKMFLIIGRRGQVDPMKRRDILGDLPPGFQLRTYDEVLRRAQSKLSAMKSGRWH